MIFALGGALEWRGCARTFAASDARDTDDGDGGGDAGVARDRCRGMRRAAISPCGLARCGKARRMGQTMS